MRSILLESHTDGSIWVHYTRDRTIIKLDQVRAVDVGQIMLWLNSGVLPE